MYVFGHGARRSIISLGIGADTGIESRARSPLAIRISTRQLEAIMMLGSS